MDLSSVRSDDRPAKPRVRFVSAGGYGAFRATSKQLRRKPAAPLNHDDLRAELKLESTKASLSSSSGMTSTSLYTVHTTLSAGLAGGGRDEVRGATQS